MCCTERSLQTQHDLSATGTDDKVSPRSCQFLFDKNQVVVGMQQACKQAFMEQAVGQSYNSPRFLKSHKEVETMTKFDLSKTHVMPTRRAGHSTAVSRAVAASDAEHVQRPSSQAMA
jgi:hypothetical protein